MISDGSEASDVNLRPLENGSSQIELNERVGNTVRELYRLLELYAPAWYTEELHEKAEAALLVLRE
jgi:hypothetical protein